MQFISDNYFVILVISVLIIMACVGYFAEKTDFGRKGLDKKEPKKTNEKEKINIIDLPNARLDSTGSLEKPLNKGLAEAFDMPIIEQPQNQNINEDLNVPFGDNLENNEAEVNVSEDLSVPLETSETSFNEDLNVPLENVESTFNEDLNAPLENVEPVYEEELNVPLEKVEPVYEEDLNAPLEETSDFEDNKEIAIDSDIQIEDETLNDSLNEEVLEENHELDLPSIEDVTGEIVIEKSDEDKSDNNDSITSNFQDTIWEEPEEKKVEEKSDLEKASWELPEASDELEVKNTILENSAEFEFNEIKPTDLSEIKDNSEKSEDDVWKF